MPVLKLQKGVELHAAPLVASTSTTASASTRSTSTSRSCPGYDYGLRVTPNAPGDYRIICNEFCGIGHHIMVGKVIVEDRQVAAATPGGTAMTSSASAAAGLPDLPASTGLPHRPRRRATRSRCNAVVVGRRRCWSASSRPCCWCSRAGRRCTCCRPIWFYRILAVHGLNMLIFFIIFFEMAVLYFAGTVAAQRRAAGAEDSAGSAFGLMLVGALLVECDDVGRAAPTCCSPRTSPLQRRIRSTTSASSCSPSARSSTVSLFFATLVVAKREKTLRGLDPAGRRSARSPPRSSR